jgi:hypothetical protein
VLLQKSNGRYDMGDIGGYRGKKEKMAAQGLPFFLSVEKWKYC